MQMRDGTEQMRWSPQIRWNMGGKMERPRWKGRAGPQEQLHLHVQGASRNIPEWYLKARICQADIVLVVNDSPNCFSSAADLCLCPKSRFQNCCIGCRIPPACNMGLVWNQESSLTSKAVHASMATLPVRFSMCTSANPVDSGIDQATVTYVVRWSALHHLHACWAAVNQSGPRY